mgnify:CR=1 FL=1
MDGDDAAWAIWLGILVFWGIWGIQIKRISRIHIICCFIVENLFIQPLLIDCCLSTLHFYEVQSNTFTWHIHGHRMSHIAHTCTLFICAIYPYNIPLPLKKERKCGPYLQHALDSTPATRPSVPLFIISTKSPFLPFLCTVLFSLFQCNYRAPRMCHRSSLPHHMSKRKNIFLCQLMLPYPPFVSYKKEEGGIRKLERRKLIRCKCVMGP